MCHDIERLRIEQITLGGVRVVIAVAAACAVMLAYANVTVLAQAQAEPEAEKPVTEVVPEQLGLNPGEPLSSTSLVNAPAKLDGVVAWTIETRRSRGNLRMLDVSHDGKFAATGGEDGTVRVWDLATGTLVRCWSGTRCTPTVWPGCPSGRTLASTGGYECTVRLWDMQTGQPLACSKTSETIRSRWPGRLLATDWRWLAVTADGSGSGTKRTPRGVGLPMSASECRR